MKRLFYKRARLILILMASIISILLVLSHSLTLPELTHQIIDLIIIIILIFTAGYIGNELTALYELSRSDSLTGLDNRSRFHDRLTKEIIRSHRYQTTFSLLVIDVDNFKSINDTCGHSAGDKTLKVLAQVMRNPLRKYDLLARIGGEEFTVLLPECQLDSAVEVAERLRKQVEAEQFDGYEVTISVGVTSLQAGDDEDSLFERADEALYMAKEKRNSVFVARGKNFKEVTINI